MTPNTDDKLQPDTQTGELEACPDCAAAEKEAWRQFSDSRNSGTAYLKCDKHRAAVATPPVDAEKRWDVTHSQNPAAFCLVCNEHPCKLIAATPSLPPAPLLDAHPEDFCHKCGQPNISWFAPNELWNKSVRAANQPEILCPVCFVKLTEAAGLREQTWRVAPRDYDPLPSAVAPTARYEAAHEARYAMTHPVHPDIVVLWFLALKSRWFDDPANMFYGQREAAKAYLYKWVETGEIADDNTTLEITTAMKFREWLASSWAATPVAAPEGEERAFRLSHS